jgi:hypothetical protein
MLLSAFLSNMLFYILTVVVCLCELLLYFVQVNQEKNRIVIKAKAVEHNKCPEVPDVVRVKMYQSLLVIEPHTSFCDVRHFSLCLN